MKSYIVDHGYKPYATARQWECYTAYCNQGGYSAAGKSLGINQSNVFRNVATMKKKAAVKGYSPDHDMYKAASPAHLVKGTSTLYDEDGDVKLQWVKTGLDIDKQQMMEEFAEAFVQDYTGRFDPTPVPTGHKLEDQLTAYVVGDAHIGLRAWAEETGEDHDTEIALQDLKNAIEVLVHGAPATHTGLLVNVGDFMHANDSSNLTKSGHSLDVDGRFSYTIDAAVLVLRHMIDTMLTIHNEVHVINVRGNHDEGASLWLNKLVTAVYEREPRVVVIPNEPRFLRYQFGSTLIGFHHGDRINRNRIYEAITRDWRSEIGESDHVYFFTGHIHHKTAEEIGCCKFESFNTLCARDKWHSDSGYGASQQIEALTIHVKYGITGRRISPIEEIRNAELS